MAYCKIEKSGCTERRGHPQIRFDMFLEPDDKRYEETYIQVPVIPAGGYPNKTNKDGTPIDQKDYDLWYASLPRIWQLNPFHSHFIGYYPHDFTDSQLKSDMDFHLANFYKAYQDGWDAVDGGMRHGYAVEKRIIPVNYAKTLEVVEYKAIQTQVINRLNRLDEFKHTPIKLDDGKVYPATTIDVGSEAIDRSNARTANNTYILWDNPANDTGALDTVETWAVSNLSGFQVGTFSGSGTSYNDRDYETIGSVTSGSKQTFTGLSIDVESGDLLGCYYSAGLLEYSVTGGAGLYYLAGSKFGSGSLSYSTITGVTVSLYATGETAAGVPTVTNSTGESNVTATAARLNGELTDDGGLTTSVTVYWGDNDGGTTAGNWDNNYSLGNQSIGTFYHDVSSLSSGTTYYYRYYAENSEGGDWADSTESFLTKPAAPTNVSATDGTHTDKVVITWTKSTGATGYKIYEGSNLLDTVGDVATFDDTTAEAPTITAGSAVASDGTYSGYVALSLSGTSANNGATRTYKVVAVNATGDSADSSTDTGYRGHGTLTYQWQRSAADSDASYSNISGATSSTYNDTDGAVDPNGRYYRCVLNATGATQQISAADRGYISDTVTYYWVGGTGNWSDATNHWATTSGGIPNAANVPTSNTHTRFDANSFTTSGQTVTVDATAYCKDMDWTGALYNPTLTISAAQMYAYGDITTISAMVISGTNWIYIYDDSTLTTNGLTISGVVLGVNNGSVVTLADDYTSTVGIAIVNGTLDTNSKTVTLGTNIGRAGSATASTLTMGSSTINVGTGINFATGNMTITANTATINISGTGQLAGGSSDWNGATFNLIGTAHTITGSNTYAELNLDDTKTQTITFTDGTTQIITSDTDLSGSSGHIHTLKGSGTSGWGISYTGGGTLLFDYLDVEYSTATQDNTFYADNSTDSGNNTRWYFSAPNAPTDVSATDGTDTGKVVITWTKSSGATGYKVYQDGLLVDTLGDVATYDDTTAEAPIITAGTADASDGTSVLYVVLTLTGMSVADGTTHTYTVKALNPIGDSSSSASDTGYRGAGTLAYQWQRSAADSDADYSNITDATTNPYNDTDGDTGGRYYRCYLTADGSIGVYSTVDRGYLREIPSSALKYTLEVRSSSGTLISILENAFDRTYTQRINEPQQLTFSMPATDSKVSDLTKPNQIWLRDYSTGDLVRKFIITKGRAVDNGKQIIPIECKSYMAKLLKAPVISYAPASQTPTQILTALLGCQILTPLITLGTVDITGSYSFSWSNTNVLKCLNDCLEAWGGYFDVDDDNELTWLDDIGSDVGQQIRYRKNLVTVEVETDYEGQNSRIYATGNSLDLLDYKPSFDPVTQSADASYGYLTLQDYKCYTGWTGDGNALPYGVGYDITVYRVSSEFSISFFSCSGTGWTDPANAIDGNVGTYTFASPGTGWTGYLTAGVNTTPVLCTGLRWWIFNTAIDDIEVQYSPDGTTWTTVVSAWNTDWQGAWGQYDFAEPTLVKNMRLRTHYGDVYVYEMEMRSTYADDTADFVQGANEQIVKCAIGDYHSGDTYYVGYTHAFYIKDFTAAFTYGDEAINATFNYAGDAETLLKYAQAQMALIKDPPKYYQSGIILLNEVDTNFSFEELDLGNIVDIIHEPLGVDDSVRIVAISKNLDNPANGSIEIQTKIRTLADIFKAMK